MGADNFGSHIGQINGAVQTPSPLSLINGSSNDKDKDAVKQPSSHA